MGVDAGRVVAELKELRALTGDTHGAQRVAWTPVWQAARAWFAEKLEGLPVVREEDAAGNVWVTLRGKSPRALLLGGHLDSVPNGGWLDGCLGVVAGLEVLRALAEAYDGVPPVTVRLVDWADEEGARFGRSLFGSAAFAGNATVEADRGRVDREGVTLEAALLGCGVAVDRVGEAVVQQANAAAYLELHIEQGPVLERMGLPLGVVLGTKGVKRHAITFVGEEAHSGSTPMLVRRDALAAAAKLALEIRPIALQHPDAVATMGSVKTFPGIVTAVVGRCEATLDLRDLDAGGAGRDVCRGESGERAVRGGGAMHGGVVAHLEHRAGCRFDATLIGFAAEAVQAVCGSASRLPSGPLHDAAEVARAGGADGHAVRAVVEWVEPQREGGYAGGAPGDGG